MKRELISLCGPFSVNSYGTALVIGILLCMWLIKKHPLTRTLNLEEKIIDIALLCIGAGLFGGRLLYVLYEPDSDLSLMGFLSLWDGGLSLLGAIVATITALMYFFMKNNIPVLPCLDLIALHAPLLQSIGRIGCFFAGCCYGIPTNRSWGFIYTDPYSMAPLHKALHPTQLYSAISLLGIFFILYCVVQKMVNKPGQLVSIYLMLICVERFCIDFWRDDRTFTSPFFSVLSTHQCFAILIFINAGTLFIYTSTKNEHI